MVKKVKIKDIGKVVTGKTPSKKIDEYWNRNDVPFLKPDDLTNSINLLKKYNTYLSNEGYLKANKIPKNSVVVSCIGTIGKVGINNIDIATNQQINCIIPNEDMNSKYLMYQMFSKKNYLNDIANAPVVPIINKTTFENIEISIHSLEEQNQIAKTLDKANELIELRKESITKLDALAKSIFIDMFGDPVSNPKEWIYDNLENIVTDDCTLSYGIVQPGDEFENGIPIVRPVDLGNLKLEKLKKTDPKISSSYKRTILHGDEILLSVRGTTGTLALVTIEFKDSNVTRGIVPIRLESKEKKLFTFGVLSSLPMQQVIQEKTYGATLKQINLSDIRKLKIINPPIELQNKFAKIIEKIEEQKSLYEKELELLQNNFDALLQKSFQE